MKIPRFLISTTLLVLIILSVVAWVAHQGQRTTTAQLPQPVPSTENSHVGRKPIFNENKPEISNTRIVSEVTTSSNRIVVVEKDGVLTTAYVPLTLPLTDDQILASIDDASGNHVLPQPTKDTRNTHLTFYGMTVDDQTNALAGVHISGSVLVVGGNGSHGMIPVNAISENDGRFQFGVDFGQMITISVDGGTNYISPSQRWFRYGSMGYGPMDSEIIDQPDFANPTLFVLTKRLPPESLIAYLKVFTAPNTGEPVNVDLITGKIVATGGDLSVSTKCLEPYTEIKKYSWSAEVKVFDGGLIRVGNQNTRMEYLHEAPTEGYTNQLNVAYDEKAPNYRRQYEGWFYVRSRGGSVYSKMYFDVSARWDERGVPFGIWAVVNTNASTHLQTAP
jgi:hypothetical protein